jgi:hypothetical protein
MSVRAEAKCRPVRGGTTDGPLPAMPHLRPTSATHPSQPLTLAAPSRLFRTVRTTERESVPVRDRPQPTADGCGPPPAPFVTSEIVRIDGGQNAGY